MADPPHSPPESAKQQLPHAHPDCEPAALRCCCGREHCVFLKHNCSVLDSVEKDVHVAAKMGQALLARHEAYMASAERDRAELNARINQLELDKAALQESNVRTVEENRALLDQLELLNGTVTESDMKIRSLEAALRSAHLTVKMLEGATARAAEMERHIANLEAEQETMQSALVHSEEEARSALYRWRMADRDIKNMHDQLERIEKEAREERERHVEVIGRMERQRAMEKDLNTAAGRLKGAAAAKTLQDGKNGSSVVSHFVRDLLQDNANLQLSMAELRELLMNSNDEIQMLREQLMYHQPVEGEVSATSTLRAELEPSGDIVAKRISQELHIHHHYHVATKPEPKKPKKRRLGLTPGIFTPPGISSPSTPIASPWHLDSASPTPALLSQSARDSTTPTPRQRWSLVSEEQSEFAPSSVPSSPRSNPRNSMFDRGIVDMSIPASPTTSVDPTSPSWRDTHRKQRSVASIRDRPTLAVPITFPTEPTISGVLHQTSQHPPSIPHRPLLAAPKEDTLVSLEATPSLTDDIPDLALTSTPTNESVPNLSGDDADTDEDMSVFVSSPTQDQFDPNVAQFPRSLRRVVSHESIMSLSNGMDIHTLKARPSQLTLRPLGAAAAGTGISTVTASPTIARGAPGNRGSVILRDNLGLAGLGPPRSRSRDAGRVISGPITGQPVGETGPAARGAFGRLVSWRLWGGSNSSIGVPQTYEVASSDSSTSPKPPGSGPPSIFGAKSTSSDGTSTRSKPSSRVKDLSRPSGINQSGGVPIPGFYEYWASHQRRGAPSKVLPDVVDVEALREGLEGG